jgi:hypothetical protein
MLIYTGVGPALTEQIRYHCPVIGFINYPKTPTKPFKRKIWLLLGIEDSVALKIALVISFVINSISPVRKSESQFTFNKFCLSFS